MVDQGGPFTITELSMEKNSLISSIVKSGTHLSIFLLRVKPTNSYVNTQVLTRCGKQLKNQPGCV